MELFRNGISKQLHNPTMRLDKKNFLVQVKYSDLARDPKGMRKVFLGFGGELYLSAEEIDSYDPHLMAEVRFAARKNNFPLRLHAPVVDIDYSHISTVTLKMQSLYHKVLKFCRFMDIHSVVSHAELDYNGKFPVKMQFENAVLLWRAISANLSAHDIGLNIENHCEIGPEYLLDLMKEVDSPYFGMCLDIGHSNAFGKINIGEWLEKYPVGSIKETHLADNAGDGDSHLALGEGNIDFSTFFKILETRADACVFVLEPRNISEAQKSLAFLRKSGLLE